MNKFSALEVFSESFKAIAMYRFSLIKCLFIPVLFVMGVDLLEHQFNTSFFSFILDIFKMFFFAVMALMIHRIILENNPGFSALSFMKISKTEMIFLLYMFFLYMFATLLIIISSFFLIPVISTTPLVYNKYIEAILLCLIFFVPLLLLSRLSLMFPAISIGERYDLNHILLISKNNSLKLFAVVGVVPFIFSYALVFLQNWRESVCEVLLISIGSVISLLLEASFLSISYKILASFDSDDILPNSQE